MQLERIEIEDVDFVWTGRSQWWRAAYCGVSADSRTSRTVAEEPSQWARVWRSDPLNFPIFPRLSPERRSFPAVLRCTYPHIIGEHVVNTAAGQVIIGFCKNRSSSISKHKAKSRGENITGTEVDQTKKKLEPK